MKAWRVHEFGDYSRVLKRETCDDPVPPERGVVIDVAAAGLNFADILAISGRYQVKAPLPFSPGLEAVGVVSAADAQSRFRVGDRVIANASWGAFAEKMATTDVSCFAIAGKHPENADSAGNSPGSNASARIMTDAHAAGFVVTYQTAYVGLAIRGRLKAGELLVVHGGAGGVGTAAIEIGKALGATVLATAGSDEKVQLCLDCGADHAVNYRTGDFVDAVKTLSGGRGADVIYDPVGGDVFDQSTKCIGFGGRILTIGFASGRIPDVKLNRVMLKNIDIIGLYWGNYLLYAPEIPQQAHRNLCDLYAQEKVQPLIGGEFGFDDLPNALDDLAGRKSRGKLVLRVA